MNIVEFLRARLDEDEQTAEPADGEFVYFEVDHTHTALHYQRHDPARVLREVEAKRSILRVAEYTEANGMPEEAAALRGAVRELAAIYADHPDYREEWKP